jgi:hypothetical protein
MLIGACAPQAHLKYSTYGYKNARAVDIQWIISGYLSRGDYVALRDQPFGFVKSW